MTKKFILLSICLMLIIPIQTYALESTKNTNSLLGKKKIDFGCSETDAEIFVNGKLLGKGNMELVVPTKDCITIIVKKIGFLKEKNEFCNKKICLNRLNLII